MNCLRNVARLIPNKDKYGQRLGLFKKHESAEEHCRPLNGGRVYISPDTIRGGLEAGLFLLSIAFPLRTLRTSRKDISTCKNLLGNTGFIQRDH